MKLNKVFYISIFCILILICVSLFNYKKTEDKKELFNAVENNDIVSVKKIIEIYPEFINKERFNFFETVFLDAGSGTPFTIAVQKCDLEMIELLVEYGADINKKVVDYPLNLALNLGKYKIAWYLIENGARLDVISGNKTLPYVITYGHIKDENISESKEDLALLKYVIEQGISINPIIDSGLPSLLGYAAGFNNVEIVKYLLDSGYFDIDDIVSDFGETALILAVKSASKKHFGYKTCEFLISSGANKEIKDNNGKTALDYAIEFEDEKLIEMLSE